MIQCNNCLLRLHEEKLNVVGARANFQDNSHIDCSGGAVVKREESGAERYCAGKCEVLIFRSLVAAYQALG